MNDAVLRFLRRSPSADEAWLTTVALNGEPELVVVNDRRRYVRWPGGSHHPAVLGPADLPALGESNAFFVRKIDPAAWPEAYDALDALGAARAGAAG